MEEKDVIQYFTRTAFWYTGTCKLRTKGIPECSNVGSCREDRWHCYQLLDQLGMSIEPEKRGQGVFPPEQISFVEFCADNVDCGADPCPAGESCLEDDPFCAKIPEKMEQGTALSDQEKGIIEYFWKEQEHWLARCKLNAAGRPQCPNWKTCVDPGFCLQLLDNLGISHDSSEEQEILEKELQKVIVNSAISGVDWQLGEKVKYHDRECPIDSGRPDILLKNEAADTLYVVELKAGTGTRENVGQLMHYVGFLRKNPPAGFKEVKGILLAKTFSEGAKFAVSTVPHLLLLRTYRLQVLIGT
ncbi:MAG: DUF1016 family protein [Chloroflexi bacterium]|nr:DUF1016 family protein [Chloroflexota bacterium]